MKVYKVEQAIREAQRFIEKAEDLLRTTAETNCFCPLESGAAKRASMDLTRSLARMRRAN